MNLKVNPDPKLLERFMTWLFEKEVLYGAPFETWWNEQGMHDFLMWAKKRHNLTYINDPEHPKE